MKTLKRLGALLLTVAMVFAIAPAVCVAEPEPAFTDVPADAWYAQAVEYCRENGLMSGTSAGRFEPGGTMTRAMLATVLYRQAGEPAVTGTDSFTDTAENAWYAKAVLWASRQGIISGYGGGLFGTNDPVTREQIVTILWRMAGSPRAEKGQPFADQDAISGYAADAVAWAQQNGVVSGKEGNRFDPKGNATRGEVAVILTNQAKGSGTTPAPSPNTPPANAGNAGSGSSGGSGSGGSSTPSTSPAQGNLAEIPGGTFQMGSPAEEPERSSDEIQHSVTVGSFFLARTEVTQKDYQAIMGTNPSDTKGDSLPVTNITWYDAVQYCNRLSQAQGLTPCYTISGADVTWNRAANGYRLPTEAEWEYAARGNTTTPFSFGDYVHNSDANCYNAYGYNNDASGSWVNGPDSYLKKPWRWTNTRPMPMAFIICTAMPPSGYGIGMAPIPPGQPPTPPARRKATPK